MIINKEKGIFGCFFFLNSQILVFSARHGPAWMQGIGSLIPRGDGARLDDEMS